MFKELQGDKCILNMVPEYPIPRYTSYPTAPHFENSINSKIYSSWLNNVKSIENLSLYIHIPFCNSLCYFCGCHTTATKKYEPVNRYVDFLIKEIHLIRSKINFIPKVSHIHFGGGTPSILKPKDLKLIMDTINKKFNVNNKCEIAMEVDPRFFKIDLIKVLKKYKFTRISIGVQDFSLIVQKNINRMQSFKSTKNLINALKHNGIKNINIDLMYGLPYQSIQSFLRTLNKVVSLKPDRISIFGYAHVPWMKKRQNLIKGDILRNKERLQLYNLTSDYLQKNKYVPIGIDHYARYNSSIIKKIEKKNLTRNFQGYSEDNSKVLLGFGSSSISSMPEGYVQNYSNVLEYFTSIKKNKIPIYRGYEFKNEDKIYGEIINNLMCYLNVNLNKIKKKFNLEKKHNFLFYELLKIKPFIDEGFVKLNNGILTIHPKARPLTRTICSSFDQFFKESKNKYSLGI